MKRSLSILLSQMLMNLSRCCCKIVTCCRRSRRRIIMLPLLEMMAMSVLITHSEHEHGHPDNDHDDPTGAHRHKNYSLTGMEDAVRLIPIIKNRSLYNMFLAPGQVKGKPTRVSVAVYIESMSSFKAQTMDFEVDMYLAMSWKDERLAHNFSHPVLIAQKGLADRIWHPDLYFVNSKFAYLQEVTTPNFMLLVYDDGLIFKSMRVDVTLSCMMELTDYPMDEQTCPIKLQSCSFPVSSQIINSTCPLSAFFSSPLFSIVYLEDAYIENLLNLTWHEDERNGYPIGSNENIKLNDMEIVDKQWEWCGYKYPMFRGTGNWSCILAKLKIKRLIMFHVIQTYVPTGMLVMISWLSFWLDPRAGPARISLTITTLLTLTTMSNGARQDLPQVSYIKALDIWLSVCTAFVFCVLLEYTLVSCFISIKTSACKHVKIVSRKLATTMDTPLIAQTTTTTTTKTTTTTTKANNDGGHHRHPHHNNLGPLPPTLRLVDHHHLPPQQQANGNGKGGGACGYCAHRWERTAKRVDKFSRAGFPALFALFSLIYWTYYLTPRYKSAG